MKRLFGRILVVGALGLLAALLVHTIRPGGHERYAAAQLRANDACRVYRSQPGHAYASVCRIDTFAPTALTMSRRADAHLAEARAAVARHDTAAAKGALVLAATEGREADRTGTAIGTIVGAEIIRKVLDVLDEGALDAQARLNVLANASLEQASSPFEGERIHLAWTLAHDDDGSLLRPSDAELADEMEQDDRTYRAMSRFAAAHDVAGCRRAAKDLGRVVGRGAAEAELCPKMSRVAEIRERLDRETAAAFAELAPPNRL